MSTIASESIFKGEAGTFWEVLQESAVSKPAGFIRHLEQTS